MGRNGKRYSDRGTPQACAAVEEIYYSVTSVIFSGADSDVRRSVCTGSGTEPVCAGIDRAVGNFTAATGGNGREISRTGRPEEKKPEMGKFPVVTDYENSGNSGGQGTADAGNQGQEEPVAAHEVYLTFDDGPSIYTEEILDILDEYQVKATFFVVGKESDPTKEALRDIVARGHTLGMHSYSHKYSELYASEEAFEADFLKLQGYLEDVTGVKSKVYRFPGGSSNTVSKVNMGIYADYLDSQEVRFFDWNISSGDGGSAVLPVKHWWKM